MRKISENFKKFVIKQKRKLLTVASIFAVFSIVIYIVLLTTNIENESLLEVVKDISLGITLTITFSLSLTFNFTINRTTNSFKYYSEGDMTINNENIKSIDKKDDDLFWEINEAYKEFHAHFKKYDFQMPFSLIIQNRIDNIHEFEFPQVRFRFINKDLNQLLMELKKSTDSYMRGIAGHLDSDDGRLLKSTVYLNRKKYGEIRDVDMALNQKLVELAQDVIKKYVALADKYFEIKSPPSVDN